MVWLYYKKLIQYLYPDIHSKLHSNVVSCTHALSVIILLSLNHFFPSAVYVNLCLFLSSIYYIHDIANRDIIKTHGKIMITHHVISIITIHCTVYYELPRVFIGFLIIELSNLPLYYTQIALYSYDRDYYEPQLQFCTKMEFASFLIFRVIGFLPIIFIVQTMGVKLLVIFIYGASVYWTFKLWKKIMPVPIKPIATIYRPRKRSRKDY